MARPKDLAIEEALRRVAREATQKDNAITIRTARDRVEKELGLEEGFFVSAEGWKKRSKKIIDAAFDEELDKLNEPAPAVQSVSKTPDSKSSNKEDQIREKPQTNGKQLKQSGSTTKRATKSATKSKLSKEQVEEQSESDSAERESTTSKQPVRPKQVNGVKRKADEQSKSSEDSESEDGSSSNDEVDTQAPAKKKARKEGSPSSEEESDESTGEDEDQENGDKKKIQAPEKTTGAAVPTTRAIPAKPFVPPAGFIPIAPDLLSTSTSLSSSNLEGKQIWHIVAPSNLSLSSIREISTEAMRSGQPVHSHNGVDYLLNEYTDSACRLSSILIPTENGYQVVDHPVQRSLQLQQKISLPNLTIRQADQNAGSSAAAVVGASQVSHARPQPKGLRMRYKPPGAGPSQPGAEDSDSESEVALLRTDATTGLTQDVDAMDVGEEVVEQTSKKAKKKRQSKETEESAQDVVNGVSNSRPGTAQSTKSSQPPIPNGVSEETLSREKRKRLKRERKEAKQKASG